MRLKNLGFTLAEVLITLGIIGVVSAITIPTLIHNHQKKVIVNKLKTNYAQLQQVFRHSVADNGDMEDWVSATFNGTTSSSTDANMKTFIEKYIMPYLSGATLYYKTRTLSSLGVVNGVTYPSGAVAFPASTKCRTIVMENGTILLLWISSITDSTTKKDKYLSMSIHALLDGASSREVFGKNVFAYDVDFQTNEFSTTNCNLFSTSTGKCYYDNTKRAKQLEYCKKGDENSTICGDLIRLDNWKIANDYPWL